MLFNWRKRRKKKEKCVISDNNGIECKKQNCEETKEITLETLATDSKHTYWKFSQSERGKSIENDVFAEYREGEVTSAKDNDKLLSFVNESTIIRCYMYGDQLTKFVFDNTNPDFAIIKNSPVKCYGGGLGEYESAHLLTEKIYSLGDINTIKRMIDFCNTEGDFNIIFYGIAGIKLENRLNQFGFYESADLVKCLFEHYKEMEGYNIAETKEKLIQLADSYCHKISTV